MMFGFAASGAETNPFFVAPAGNDAWSGRLELPLTDKTDGPFATLPRARDAIRAIRQKIGESVSCTVQVRGGTYVLTEPFILTPEDSGGQNAVITYSAYPGETPILTGARPVSGWKSWKEHILVADVSGMNLPASDRPFYLFYKGEFQPLARVPNRDPARPRTGGFLYPPLEFVAEDTDKVKENSQEGTLAYDPADWRTWQQAPTTEQKASKRILRYDPSTLDPSRWKQIERGWIHVAPLHNWNINYIPLKELDRKNHQILLAGDASYGLERDTRFYFDNLFEELDAPGEWFLDAKENKLYFWPPEEHFDPAQVALCTLGNLLHLAGVEGKPVDYIHFTGFELAHVCGPAAVVLSHVHRCRFAKNRIHHVSQGLSLNGDQNEILGNDFHQISGSAVSANGRENRFDNNDIRDLATVDVWSWSAVSIGGVKNTFSHNRICYTPALGIGFGGLDNLFEYNEIHHIGLESTLSGGIYSHAGNQAAAEESTRGTIIRYNKITDTVGYGMAAPGEWGANPGWGIWLDDFIGYTTIYGNILVRNARGAVQLHGGRYNTFENTIMPAGIPSTINHIRKGTEPCFNKVLRNIIYYANPDPVLIRRYGRIVKGISGTVESLAPLFLCGWNLPQTAIEESDYNLFYPIDFNQARHIQYFIGVAAETIQKWTQDIPADRFAWWKTLGYDKHSLTADHLFEDLENDDFRLRPESPALKLGFQPIPVDQIGLYADEHRASWPVENTLARWKNKTFHPYADFIH